MNGPSGDKKCENELDSGVVCHRLYSTETANIFTNEAVE
jgi:hypothetical protein